MVAHHLSDDVGEPRTEESNREETGGAIPRRVRDGGSGGEFTEIGGWQIYQIAELGKGISKKWQPCAKY